VLRQAVILAEGSDAPPTTRFGDRTATAPKSMLNVGGRPFLDTLIDEIARYNAFEEILLLAGDRAEHILARYAGAVRGRARLTVALEREPLGTAGALAHAAVLLQKRFLLLNGTSFFDFNLLDLVSSAGASFVHMALRAVRLDHRAPRRGRFRSRSPACRRSAVGPPDRGLDQ
jgi:NDP-sugar pyrophosphorylase family protein